MSDTFCVNDDVMFLAHLTLLDDVVDQCLLVIIVSLWEQNVFCSVGNTTPKCNVTCMSTHNFDNTTSLMRRRSISNLIDCFHCSIYCCIKTDGVICTCNIKVNGSLNADCIDTLSSKCLCSTIRTVTTNYNKSINSMFAADFCSTLLHFQFCEFRTSGCTQNSTTLLDDIRYISSHHISDFFIEESHISSIYAFNLQPFCDSCSNNCTNGSIHSWCISTTCKYSNSLYLIGHGRKPPKINFLIYPLFHI